MAFAKYSDFPLEVRQRVRDYAIEDRSPHVVTLDQLSPVIHSHAPLPDLAVVSSEWQKDVERRTFQVLQLQLGDMSLHHLETFANVMNNKRYRHLKALRIHFDYPDGLDGGVSRHCDCYQLTNERISELLAVLHKLEVLDTGEQRHRISISLATPSVTRQRHAVLYDTPSATLISDQLVTHINSLMEGTPKVSSVFCLDLPSDLLPPSVMPLLIGRFPNLQHIGLSAHHCTNGDYDVWDRGSSKLCREFSYQCLLSWGESLLIQWADFFRTTLPSCTPNVTSMHLNRFDPSTYGPVDDDEQILLLPPMRMVHSFINSFKQYTSKLRILYIHDFTMSTTFCRKFLCKLKQSSAGQPVDCRWPNLRRIEFDIPRSSDVVASRKKCKDLFTAAGRAAAVMPLLEQMLIHVGSSSADGTPGPAAHLKFSLSSVETSYRSNRPHNSQMAVLLFRGLKEKDPGVTAAWDYAEKIRGLKFHTQWHLEESGSSSDDDEETLDYQEMEFISDNDDEEASINDMNEALNNEVEEADGEEADSEEAVSDDDEESSSDNSDEARSDDAESN